MVPRPPQRQAREQQAMPPRRPPTAARTWTFPSTHPLSSRASLACATVVHVDPRAARGESHRSRLWLPLRHHPPVTSTQTKLLIAGIVLASLTGLMLSAVLAFYGTPR